MLCRGVGAAFCVVPLPTLPVLWLGRVMWSGIVAGMMDKAADVDGTGGLEGPERMDWVTRCHQSPRAAAGGEGADGLRGAARPGRFSGCQAGS